MIMLRTQVHPARTVDLPGVAAVLQDAFSDKMRVILGNQPDKVRALLEAAYTGPVQRGYDGVLVAERGGRIVGTALIEPVHYTDQENRHFEHIAVRELGMPRMLWGAFLLWMLGHRPEPDEAHIRELAVAQDCRDEGIGSLLLEYIEAWAWNHDRQRVTLWAAANNAPALYVYEKAGYTVRRTRANWLIRLVFGISQWHHMEKALEAPPLLLSSPTRPEY
jgi:ribosomal protein S18 acetylase RimI-like enzyme